MNAKAHGGDARGLGVGDGLTDWRADFLARAERALETLDSSVVRLGSVTGLSVSHLYNLLAGRAAPKRETLLRLEETLPEHFEGLLQADYPEAPWMSPSTRVRRKRPVAGQSKAVTPAAAEPRRLPLVAIPQGAAEDGKPFSVPAFDFEGHARGLGAAYLVHVEAGWLEPEVRAGDILLVQPGTLYASDDIVLVRTGAGTELRRVREHEGAFHLASPDLVRFATIAPADATVVGIAVGLLRLDRPL